MMMFIIMIFLSWWAFKHVRLGSWAGWVKNVREGKIDSSAQTPTKNNKRSLSSGFQKTPIPRNPRLNGKDEGKRAAKKELRKGTKDGVPFTKDITFALSDG